MKVLAIGCLHGKVPSGLKTFCEKNKVEAIFCCGDLAEESEIRDFQFQNWKKIGENANSGMDYKHLVNALIGKLSYKQMEKKGAERGLHVIDELAKLNIPVYWIAGNHDGGLGKKNIKKVKYANGKAMTIGKSKVLFWSNYVGSNSKPHLVKKEKVSEIRWSKIAEQANKLHEKTFSIIEKAKPDIIVTHDPPYDTKFDVVVNAKSPMNGFHVGDAIMYEVIKDFKPKLVLCAHMHEHHGKTKLDKTTIVCTGYGHDGQAALIDLPSLKVKIVKV